MTIVLIIMGVVLASFTAYTIVSNLKDKPAKPKGSTEKPQKPVLEEPSTNSQKPSEEPEKPAVGYLGKGWDEAVEEVLDDVLMAFSDIMQIKKESCTYSYLKELTLEACSQYTRGYTSHGLPSIIQERNFPNIYNFYGSDGKEYQALNALLGWLVAMQLAEINPLRKNEIFSTGYTIGGYDKDSNLYGWKFKCDPNVCRLSASVIYAMMRGHIKPDIKMMKEEAGIDDEFLMSLSEAREGDVFSVSDDNFYVDLRRFMPTAPGPYAPGYKNRDTIGGYPYPNEPKESDYNLKIDRAIYEYITSNYNLSGNSFIDKTVQAIADKDANYNHLFGKERAVGDYTFNPAFTFNDLGQEVYPSLAKELCVFIDEVIHIGSNQRCILQGHEKQMALPQYGRLRPGCSWTQEAVRHSKSDDTKNVLVNFDIEDNDGHPTGYYDENGRWTHANIHSKEEFNDYMKDELWANSYPSGHSAGIWSAALVLIEMIPHHADRIMKAANQFAVNRTIARYHWNSDTIQGRVLASCIAPVIRCCTDYSEKFNEAKKYLK